MTPAMRQALRKIIAEADARAREYRREKEGGRAAERRRRQMAKRGKAP